MCMLENELENQLGEFHIKMKGMFKSPLAENGSVVIDSTQKWSPLV